MEEWNAGMLGIKAEVKHYNCKKLLQTRYSITPLFHYSNGCITSLLIAIQDFLVSGFRCQVSGISQFVSYS
jgi:hypothetical protein